MQMAWQSCLTLGLATLASAAVTDTPAAPAKPSIVHVIADDLGFNDVWQYSAATGEVSNNKYTFTPHMERIISGGIALTAYHTYKVCSPSRTSIMTGRYPWGVGYYDMHGPEAVPLDFKMAPQLLKDAGWHTHAIGKWNLGHHLFPYTPTRRGFSTFFGYYAACQVDYWYHGAPANECGTNAPGDPVTDFNNSTEANILPAHGWNGTYNEELFTQEALRLIATHTDRTPFYMYLAYHNVHGAVNLPSGTLQAPLETVKLYNRTQLDTYKVAGAMITKLDDGVGAVQAALEARAAPYILAFCADNGGPLDHATNAPLKGGKHTLWDGGLRVTAWVFSPLIPPSRRGTVWAGLMHASDWLPTWVVGVAAQDPAVATGPRPLDGHSMWAAWTTENATSPRTEVIHQVVNTHCDENCTFDGKPAPCSVAPFGNTIRLGDYKALAGSPGPTNIVPFPAPGANPVEFGTHHAEGNNGSTVEPGTDHARAGGVGAGGWQGPATQHDCNPWCLYNVVKDPAEQHDLASDPAYASTLKQLIARVEEAAATGPAWAWPMFETNNALQQEMCTSAHKTGFYEPLHETAPPPPQ